MRKVWAQLLNHEIKLVLCSWYFQAEYHQQQSNNKYHVGSEHLSSMFMCCNILRIPNVYLYFREADKMNRCKPSYHIIR